MFVCLCVCVLLLHIGGKHPIVMDCSCPRKVAAQASLQFANPLHAQFILHLCGFSAKLKLCRPDAQDGRWVGKSRKLWQADGKFEVD